MSTNLGEMIILLGSGRANITGSTLVVIHFKESNITLKTILLYICNVIVETWKSSRAREMRLV